MINEKIKKYFLYLTLFIVGAVILVMEIAGTRILSPFYGSTIFVWSSLITITLGFLASGYFLGGIFADRYPKTKNFYLAVFLGAASSLFLIKISQHLLIFSDKFGFKFGPLVAAFLLFALPFLFLSMAGPFVIRLRSRGAEHSGHVSGIVFGVSTSGSLAGALLSGFYLVPNFSLSNIFVFFAGAVMLTAIIGLALEKISYKILALIIFLALIFLVIPFLKYKGEEKEVSIIFEDRSFYAELKVVELPYVKTVLMDGAPQSIFIKQKGLVYAEETDQVRRVLEELYPTDADVLVLGFGVGTAADILPRGLRVDYVELDPKMIELAVNYFNYSLGSDDNDRIIIADARAFLRKTNKKYDLIFSDLYHGSAMPFHTHTKEALELAKARLKTGGMFVSNIVAGPNSDLIASVEKTMREVFPKVFASVKIGHEEKEITNILAYGIMAEDANEPLFKYRHKKNEMETGGGVVITDDKNPMEVLSLQRFDNFRESTISAFGYEPLFTI